jgi:hypothetical protein
MRRLGLMIGVILAVATLVAGPVSAAKQPRLTSVLVHDGSCGFTVTAGWSGGTVGSVSGMWAVDGSVVTTTFADVVKGRTVTMTPAPGTAKPDASSHAWYVITQFYSGPGMSGVKVGEATSNVVQASCLLVITPW